MTKLEHHDNAIRDALQGMKVAQFALREALAVAARDLSLRDIARIFGGRIKPEKIKQAIDGADVANLGLTGIWYFDKETA